MTQPPETGRAAAIVDFGAIERNCATLAARLGEGTALCAVVKADGYGHGAAGAAGAALRGGASRIAVATAGEAAELRLHFPEAPLLVMGALTGTELRTALGAGADVAVWTERFMNLCSNLAGEAGSPVRVHVKQDTGMGRLGERDPEAVVGLARACAEDPRLELSGFWTHFATAEEEDRSYFEHQLGAFEAVASRVREIQPGVTIHSANSAATLADPRSHFDMVRCGIAIYGLDPFGSDPRDHGLEPALELRSYVATVKRFEAGASAGYGRSWAAPEDTWVGVLPIGYGDGVRRALSNDAEVLVRGDRYPVVGTISMDNLTIDLGPETGVEPGDVAVLLGSQGSETISAEQVAATLKTINYEVTTQISPRVPRVAAG